MAGAAEPPAFAGFGPRALDFLKALGFHQDRAWYEANRQIWEEDGLTPLRALVAALSERLADLPLQGNARAVFRLHRDVRFAKDKRPFKTNGGAILTRDGDKRSVGLLYVHVDPDGCFAAAGFYMPEPPALLKLRRRIAAKPAAFRGVVTALAAERLEIGLGGGLTRLPKGFEAVTDPDIGAALKLRSLVVREPIPDAALLRPDLPDRVAAFARRAEPLLRFGWTALAAPDPD